MKAQKAPETLGKASVRDVAPDKRRLNFLESCRNILEDRQTVEFLYRVVSGENVDVKLTKEGDLVMMPASAETRLKAIDMLSERVHGKAPQAVQHSGEVRMPLKVIIETV
jgi:hypothetical protein